MSEKTIDEFKTFLASIPSLLEPFLKTPVSSQNKKSKANKNEQSSNGGTIDMIINKLEDIVKWTNSTILVEPDIYLVLFRTAVLDCMDEVSTILGSEADNDVPMYDIHEVDIRIVVRMLSLVLLLNTVPSCKKSSGFSSDFEVTREFTLDSEPPILATIKYCYTWISLEAFQNLCKWTSHFEHAGQIEKVGSVNSAKIIFDVLYYFWFYQQQRTDPSIYREYIRALMNTILKLLIFQKYLNGLCSLKHKLTDNHNASSGNGMLDMLMLYWIQYKDDTEMVVLIGNVIIALCRNQIFLKAFVSYWPTVSAEYRNTFPSSIQVIIEAIVQKFSELLTEESNFTQKHYYDILINELQNNMRNDEVITFLLITLSVRTMYHYVSDQYALIGSLWLPLMQCHKTNHSLVLRIFKIFDRIVNSIKLYEIIIHIDNLIIFFEILKEFVSSQYLYRFQSHLRCMVKTPLFLINCEVIALRTDLNYSLIELIISLLKFNVATKCDDYPFHPAEIAIQILATFVNSTHVSLRDRILSMNGIIPLLMECVRNVQYISPHHTSITSLLTILADSNEQVIHFVSIPDCILSLFQAMNKIDIAFGAEFGRVLKTLSQHQAMHDQFMDNAQCHQWIIDGLKRYATTNENVFNDMCGVLINLCKLTPAIVPRLMETPEYGSVIVKGLIKHMHDVQSILNGCAVIEYLAIDERTRTQIRQMPSGCKLFLSILSQHPNEKHIVISICNTINALCSGDAQMQSSFGAVKGCPATLNGLFKKHKSDPVQIRVIGEVIHHLLQNKSFFDEFVKQDNHMVILLKLLTSFYMTDKLCVMTILDLMYVILDCCDNNKLYTGKLTTLLIDCLDRYYQDEIFMEHWLDIWTVFPSPCENVFNALNHAWPLLFTAIKYYCESSQLLNKWSRMLMIVLVENPQGQIALSSQCGIVEFSSKQLNIELNKSGFPLLPCQLLTSVIQTKDASVINQLLTNDNNVITLMVDAYKMHCNHLMMAIVMLDGFNELVHYDTALEILRNIPNLVDILISGFSAPHVTNRVAKQMDILWNIVDTLIEDQQYSHVSELGCISSASIVTLLNYLTLRPSCVMPCVCKLMLKLSKCCPDNIPKFSPYIADIFLAMCDRCYKLDDTLEWTDGIFQLYDVLLECEANARAVGYKSTIIQRCLQFLGHNSFTSESLPYARWQCSVIAKIVSTKVRWETEDEIPWDTLYQNVNKALFHYQTDVKVIEACCHIMNSIVDMYPDRKQCFDASLLVLSGLLSQQFMIKQPTGMELIFHTIETICEESTMIQRDTMDNVLLAIIKLLPFQIDDVQQDQDNVYLFAMKLLMKFPYSLIKVAMDKYSCQIHSTFDISFAHTVFIQLQSLSDPSLILTELMKFINVPANYSCFEAISNSFELLINIGKIFLETKPMLCLEKLLSVILLLITECNHILNRTDRDSIATIATVLSVHSGAPALKLCLDILSQSIAADVALRDHQAYYNPEWFNIAKDSLVLCKTDSVMLISVAKLISNMGLAVQHQRLIDRQNGVSSVSVMEVDRQFVSAFDDVVRLYFGHPDVMTPCITAANALVIDSSTGDIVLRLLLDYYESMRMSFDSNKLIITELFIFIQTNSNLLQLDGKDISFLRFFKILHGAVDYCIDDSALMECVATITKTLITRHDESLVDMIPIMPTLCNVQVKILIRHCTEVRVVEVSVWIIFSLLDSPTTNSIMTEVLCGEPNIHETLLGCMKLGLNNSLYTSIINTVIRIEKQLFHISKNNIPSHYEVWIALIWEIISKAQHEPVVVMNCLEYVLLVVSNQPNMYRESILANCDLLVMLSIRHTSASKLLHFLVSTEYGEPLDVSISSQHMTSIILSICEEGSKAECNIDRLGEMVQSINKLYATNVKPDKVENAADCVTKLIPLVQRFQDSRVLFASLLSLCNMLLPEVQDEEHIDPVALCTLTGTTNIHIDTVSMPYFDNVMTDLCGIIRSLLILHWRYPLRNTETTKLILLSTSLIIKYITNHGFVLMLCDILSDSIKQDEDKIAVYQALKDEFKDLLSLNKYNVASLVALMHLLKTIIQPVISTEESFQSYGEVILDIIRIHINSANVVQPSCDVILIIIARSSKETLAQCSHVLNESIWAELLAKANKQNLDISIIASLCKVQDAVSAKLANKSKDKKIIKTEKLEVVEKRVIDKARAGSLGIDGDVISIQSTIAMDVFKGTWRDTEIVLKTLPQDDADPQVRESWLLELSNLSALRHPRIVMLLGYTDNLTITDNYNAWLVTSALVLEYMSLGNLRMHLNQHFESLTIQEKLTIMTDVCHGMQYLHAAEYCHRDLKSIYVLLDERKRAKLTGFGSGSNSGWITTASGGAKASVSSKRKTKQDDIKAFGVLLWEVLTGKDPIKELKYNKKGNDNMLPLSEEEQRNIPKQLLQLMQQCVETSSETSFSVLVVSLQSVYEDQVNSFKEKKKAIPDGFLCPITQDIMKDPVILADGHSYERKAITDWLSRSNRSPLTNEVISTTIMIDNRALKAAIETYAAQMDSI